MARPARPHPPLDRRCLKRRKGIAFQGRLHHLRDLEARGELPTTSVQVAIAGWEAHARYGNTTGLREAILRDNRD